jgi:hypothetical protein
VILKLFPRDHLQISEDLGGPLNYFSVRCLNTVLLCAIDDGKYEKKEADTVLNLFHK